VRNFNTGVEAKGFLIVKYCRLSDVLFGGDLRLERLSTMLSITGSWNGVSRYIRLIIV